MTTPMTSLRREGVPALERAFFLKRLSKAVRKDEARLRRELREECRGTCSIDCEDPYDCQWQPRYMHPDPLIREFDRYTLRIKREESQACCNSTICQTKRVCIHMPASCFPQRHRARRRRR